MQKLWHRVRQCAYRLVTLVSRSGSTSPQLESAGSDWLPPVLSPSDWSHGLLIGLADRSAAWYFDHR